MTEDDQMALWDMPERLDVDIPAHVKRIKGWWVEITGHCFFCRQHLVANQPGGRQVRHALDNTPYGQCREAIRVRTPAPKPSHRRRR